MQNRNRIISLVLCAAVACAMLFSALFVVVEAEHDCHGELCKICAQVQVCLRTLDNSFFEKDGVSGCTAAVFAAVLILGAVIKGSPSLTLVELRTKLSS